MKMITTTPLLEFLATKQGERGARNEERRRKYEGKKDKNRKKDVCAICIYNLHLLIDNTYPILAWSDPAGYRRPKATRWSRPIAESTQCRAIRTGRQCCGAGRWLAMCNAHDQIEQFRSGPRG